MVLMNYRYLGDIIEYNKDSNEFFYIKNMYSCGFYDVWNKCMFGIYYEDNKLFVFFENFHFSFFDIEKISNYMIGQDVFLDIKFKNGELCQCSTSENLSLLTLDWEIDNGDNLGLYIQDIYNDTKLREKFIDNVQKKKINS